MRYEVYNLRQRKLKNPKTIFLSYIFQRFVSLQIAKTVVIFFITISGLTLVEAQNESKVLAVSARTYDSILFQIFAKENVVKGEDILLGYTVSNQGKKNIYLVIDPLFTNIKVKESWIFEVSEPVAGYDEHLPFNYQFIKIRPNKTYKGSIVISETFISTSGLENLSSATIRAGFSYLFDISKLGGCENAEYILPCLNELHDKSKSLTIGNLVIGIKKK